MQEVNLKKILYLFLFIVLIFGSLTACSEKGNSDEIWESEKFLAQFENFEHEIKLFIEWNKEINVNGLENSIGKIINEKQIDCLYAVWKTYLLETEIGTEIEFYELEGIDVVYNVYLIPRKTVKNTVLQLYDIKEDEIRFEEWENFNIIEYENPEYFKLLIAFGGKLVSIEILYNTLEYCPSENIVIFDVQYYEPETIIPHEIELAKLRFKFQPFMYKDTIQQYKFISISLANG